MSQLWHNFAKTACKSLKNSGRACKPDCLGTIANKQVVWNQPPLTVNDVNFGSVDRFCVTPASQFFVTKLFQLCVLGLAFFQDGDVGVGFIPTNEEMHRAVVSFPSTHLGNALLTIAL
jgi:hypothetical protein